MKRCISRIGLTIFLTAGLLPGCVDRRFIITTEPFGAVALDEKGQPMGATPVDRQFTYYGKYRFTLVKDGAQTMVVEERVKAPWYEIFPLDFVSENLIPWTIRDVRHFHYQLQPAQMVPPETVLEQGTQARTRAQGIGVPITNPAPVPEAPPPMMPPATLLPPSLPANPGQ